MQSSRKDGKSEKGNKKLDFKMYCLFLTSFRAAKLANLLYNK
jgi:hypothetical protein